MSPDTSDSETQQDEPERVVMMDGETATELLMHGETEVTLFDGEDGELVRKPTKIINTAGTHPLYQDHSPGDEEEERRPLWKKLVPPAVTVAVVAAITGGVVHLMPSSTIVINGEATTFPPAGGAMWSVIAVIALITFIVIAFPYLPGKAGGVHR